MHSHYWHRCRLPHCIIPHCTHVRIHSPQSAMRSVTLHKVIVPLAVIVTVVHLGCRVTEKQVNVCRRLPLCLTLAASCHHCHVCSRCLTWHPHLFPLHHHSCRTRKGQTWSMYMASHSLIRLMHENHLKHFSCLNAWWYHVCIECITWPM